MQIISLDTLVEYIKTCDKICRIFFPKEIAKYYYNKMYITRDSDVREIEIVYTVQWSKPDNYLIDLIQSNVPFFLCISNDEGGNVGYVNDGVRVLTKEYMRCSDAYPYIIEYMESDEYNQLKLTLDVLDAV